MRVETPASRAMSQKLVSIKPYFTNWVVAARKMAFFRRRSSSVEGRPKGALSRCHLPVHNKAPFVVYRSILLYIVICNSILQYTLMGRTTSNLRIIRDFKETD